MKALILAGGTGTRLRPFTHTMPKQLIPVANKPVLEHVLGNVRELGITEVGIIVNDWAPEIVAQLGGGSRFGLRLKYIRQDKPRGLAHAVLVARDFIGTDDFVMYLGDNVLADSITNCYEEFAAKRPAAHILVTKVTDPRAFGVAEIDRDGAVLRLTEKPRHPRSDLALTGVYFFTPAIHRAVAAIGLSARGELEITDAIQWLLTAGEEVTASQYDGYFRDIGRVKDVLECNRKLLDDLRPSVGGTIDADSTLTGPVTVEAGARVTRSVIEGPAIVGAGSLVRDSHVGPHTSIGRDCVLTRARIDYSVVLEGATISDVRDIRGSMIGRHATVTTADPGTLGQCLVVGDGSSVTLAR
ncbi:MAG TPA: glucose-1-phosphate thymidylyltransferase [Streptosporangiaceae bacterium]|nr:glucose-1-phosphate thymidylyltransferase [Streptosporangiaceae bacterium]